MVPKLAVRHKILLVDDHAVVRDGLKLQISLHRDLEVCGEAENTQDAMRLVEETHPDLAVVDISLKNSHGIDLIKRIKAHHCHVKMLVLTMYNESLYGERALRAGALGFLNKQESREQIIDAIRTVLSGKRYISQQLTERLVRQAVAGHDRMEACPVQTLTDRELQVFKLIGEGLSTGAVARHLHLSPHTIDTHREKIKLKLGLSSAGELQREAVQWLLENG